MKSHDRPIILILGPTAGGKTHLAIELACALPGGGECICCDSMQVYRGMDIGTATPTAKEHARAPHHLFDIADPADDSFSVDRWLDLAERAITDIRSRGRYPIVVGGTNLYVQSLLKGMLDGPEIDAALRARLEAIDPDELRTRLEQVDPEAAARIHTNDRRRTIRALEVFEQTGRPISELQGQWAAEGVRPDVFIIGLEYAPEAINRRINARVRQMIEAGLVQEVRGLLEADRLGVQASQALGYKQIIEALKGRISLDEAIEQVKIRTRRYGKQQRTWLKRFRAHRPSLWIAANDESPQTIAAQSLTAILIEAPGAPDTTNQSGRS